ncbi:MAG: helix-turn-helix transcriptional regulator [Flavobacteriales bacterium]|nr:helix-turn-helix transcriptional regulator [Flavobacteriales bacterium]
MVIFNLMQTSPHLKIKKTRTLKGFSQQYMADQLNISQMAYSKIERNKTQLNWDKLKKLAEILSINIWDLVDDKKEITESDLGGKSPNETVLLLKRLLHQHEYQINTLEEEIKFLRKQLALK